MTAPVDTRGLSALYRFVPYCGLVGADPKTVAKEIAAGRAPLVIVTLGERGDRYVTRASGDRYLALLKAGITDASQVAA